MSENFDVVIVDSGVGGLTILDEVRQIMPDLNLCYLADHGFFPYGTKTEKEVLNRMTHVVGALKAKYNSRIFIIACNTASTVVLPSLRNNFQKTKFIGVVPAIKPAAKLSETKKIALLATPATVERQYTDNLIRDFACDCEVFRLGDEALAKEAEKKLTGEVIDEKLLHEILSP